MTVPPDKLRLYERLVAAAGLDPKWPPNPEYVAVPDTLLAKTKSLTPYFERSYRYALSLRPKAKNKS